MFLIGTFRRKVYYVFGSCLFCYILIVQSCFLILFACVQEYELSDIFPFRAEYVRPYPYASLRFSALYLELVIYYISAHWISFRKTISFFSAGGCLQSIRLINRLPRSGWLGVPGGFKDAAIDLVEAYRLGGMPGGCQLNRFALSGLVFHLSWFSVLPPTQVQ